MVNNLIIILTYIYMFLYTLLFIIIIYIYIYVQYTIYSCINNNFTKESYQFFGKF